MLKSNLHLPRSLDIGGDNVAIDADFRNVLEILSAFEDGDLTEGEQRKLLIDRLYSEPVADLGDALAQAYWFLSGGSERKSSGRGKDYGQLYSWVQDRLYILSAVDAVLGYSCRHKRFVHWWDFLGAWMAVTESAISSAIHLRKRKKQGPLTKEERKQWDEDPDFYELRTTSDDAADALLKMLQGE